jgi:hypothetical protein
LQLEDTEKGLEQEDTEITEEKAVRHSLNEQAHAAAAGGAFFGQKLLLGFEEDFLVLVLVLVREDMTDCVPIRIAWFCARSVIQTAEAFTTFSRTRTTMWLRLRRAATFCSKSFSVASGA